ncbi:hypothetical protein IE53DRAFT_310980 [Violaceomyces palustris]|uniref:Uncharacterized protein n=1 Tax=Violaceomyces palustris TaxID=1673888 RepID=A0ACD0P4Q4_9BASI|nr:hypothetical protein IE53DRAFT_310980 [Violaceomyces palustris]
MLALRGDLYAIPTSSTIQSPSIPTPTSILDSPEVDSDNCRLLGPFALVVQATMGLLVVGSLIYKRQREKPKRKWKIWILDITKQMLGQVFVHTLNVVLSDLVAKEGGNNPCSLYFLNILVDTTLGVFFIYVTLRFITHALTDRFGLTGFVSGQYRDPAAPGARRSRPRISYWLKQLSTYLLTIFLMKLAVLALFDLFPFLFVFGEWLLDLFGDHKNAQIVFSMALFPLVMNVLQFWLIDTLLRHNPETSVYAKVGNGDEEDGESRSSFESTRNCASRTRDTGNGYQDAGRSRNRSSSAHLIGEASDSESDSDHAIGSGSSNLNKKGLSTRRRLSPSGSVQRETDGLHNYPPDSQSLYGSVMKSPPLRASSPPTSDRVPALISTRLDGSISSLPATSSGTSRMDDLRLEAGKALSDGGGGSDPEEDWDNGREDWSTGEGNKAAGGSLRSKRRVLGSRKRNRTSSSGNESASATSASASPIPLVRSESLGLKAVDE